MNFCGFDEDVELEMFRFVGEARVYGLMEVRLVCLGLMAIR